MKRRYVVIAGKFSDTSDDHWRECERQNVPYVSIRPARKFAWVELDMTSTNLNLDEQTRAEMRKLMLRYTGTDRHVICGEALCRAEGVLISEAKKLAGEMFQIVDEGKQRLVPLRKPAQI